MAGKALTRPLPYADYAEWLHNKAADISLEWWQKTLRWIRKAQPHRSACVQNRKDSFGEKSAQLSSETTRKLDHERFVNSRRTLGAPSCRPYGERWSAA